MTLPVSPEILLAMLRQERLQRLADRAEADEQIRIIEAQIAGVEMTLQVQARAVEAAAAEAAAASAETTEEKAD